ncbi:MAG: ABC transporter substrate-binding protein [Deltaproteobacteria bacterium]|nr:ABC transporter substrate-binding protein [Deltaproteobacteria bacterium]
MQLIRRIVLFGMLIALVTPLTGYSQSRKVLVAMPGHTIAGLSFLTAKLNGYYAGEGLDAELIAMRAPTANLAVLSGSAEFSTVPLIGLTTALRGGALKVLLVHFDKPQHALIVKNDIQNLKLLRGKRIAVSGPSVIDDLLLREYLAANGIDGGRDVNILSIGSADTRVVHFCCKGRRISRAGGVQRSGFSSAQRRHRCSRRDLAGRLGSGRSFRARFADGISSFARQSTRRNQSVVEECEDRRAGSRENL